MKGHVKWFSNTMKFGFVITDDGHEVFVHFSDIQCEGYKTLKKGGLVEFELAQTPKGLRAVNVKRLDSQGEKKKDKNVNASGQPPSKAPDEQPPKEEL